VGTRTCPQTRSHAQKFFRKLDKQGELDDFLKEMDLNLGADDSPTLKGRREKRDSESSMAISLMRK
jgi:hypothetical protein